MSISDMAADMRQALDPVAFAVQRLDFQPDPWQADVLRSARRNALLNCSRQSGKSTITAIIALHQAVFRPGSLALLGSPSLRQSRGVSHAVAPPRMRTWPNRTDTKLQPHPSRFRKSFATQEIRSRVPRSVLIRSRGFADPGHGSRLESTAHDPPGRSGVAELRLYWVPFSCFNGSRRRVKKTLTQSTPAPAIAVRPSTPPKRARPSGQGRAPPWRQTISS